MLMHDADVRLVKVGWLMVNDTGLCVTSKSFLKFPYCVFMHSTITIRICAYCDLIFNLILKEIKGYLGRFENYKRLVLLSCSKNDLKALNDGRRC